MKFKKIINVLIIFVITLSLSSCEDFFSDDNADPNAPRDVTVPAALPSIELTIVDSYGGLWSNFGNMFIQQVEGVERQWESFNKYDIQPVRFNGSWTQMYENVLIELREVNRKATDGGFNHYLGVAKTLEAYFLMMSTDVWGDIPYTQAGLGDEFSDPVYDDQATVIMPAIKTLLDDALVLFNNVESGTVTPGSEDVLYEGDIDNWKLAVHGLLARYHLRLGDAANALAEAKQSFTSSAENFGYNYPGAGNDAPWYGFNDVREGDIEFHPTMRALLISLNDTDRLAVMDQPFNGKNTYLTANQRVNLLTYREIQFIIAETSTNQVEQYTAYLNGIKASFEELGLSDAQYNSYVSQSGIGVGQGNLTLQNVMTQKYIALFVQPEAFIDWRRTGIPNLTPVAGSSVARRWFYPENEYLFNENAPARDSDLLFKNVDYDQ